MKIICQVADREFSIPCGEGGQTVRWLGLVVAQRYSLNTANGKLRLREDASKRIGSHLPRCVCDALRGGTDLNPSAKIKDVLDDGQKVTVEIHTQMDVDGGGNPQLSEWEAAAFLHTKIGKERFERMASNSKNVAANAAMLEEAERKKAEFPTESSDFEIRDAMSTSAHARLLTVDDIGEALDFDWSKMHTDEFGERKDTAKLKKSLEIFYLEFDGLFQHFSLLGKLTGSHTLTLNEWRHFAHQTHILHAVGDASLMQEIFVESSQSRPDLPNGIQRAEFIECIVRLAMHKYPSPVPITKALSELMSHHIKPLLFSLSGNDIRSALQHPLAQAMVQDNRERLMKVFDFYSGQSSDQSNPPNVGTLTEQEFSTLVRDLGFYNNPKPGDADQIMSAFNNAQHCTTKPSRGGMDKNGPLDELIFAEFVEALSVLAVSRWSVEPSSVHKKLQLAFQSIGFLARGIQSPRP